MPDFAGALPPTSRIAPATSWHPAVAQKQEDVPMLLSEGGWRRGRDSNPRGGYKPPTRFPVAFLRPTRTPLLTDNPHEKPVSKKMPDFAGALPRSRIAPATSWHPAVAQKHEDVPMLLSEALACPAVAQKHEAFTHAFERRRVAEREGFEPSVQFYPYNRLAGGCLQPARPPLRANILHEYSARLRRCAATDMHNRPRLRRGTPP